MCLWTDFVGHFKIFTKKCQYNLYYVQTVSCKEGTQNPWPYFIRILKRRLTPFAQQTDFVCVNFVFKLQDYIIFSTRLLHQIHVCVAVHDIWTHSMTHQNHASGCHGDIFACEYGPHAPCDHHHHCATGSSFLFMKFLFIFLALKFLFVYIHCLALTYVLSSSQF
jgi:hypothetical protein